LATRLWERPQPIGGTPAIKYLADIRGIDTDALLSERVDRTAGV